MAGVPIQITSRQLFVVGRCIRHGISPMRHYRQKGTSQELEPKRLVLPEDHGYIPTLSPTQVASLLAINETGMMAKVRGQHSVRGFEGNQLASNHPVEDRRAQARMLEMHGLLFGVFDGHGGWSCAQAISERLLNYIAVSLLSQNKLEALSHAMRTDSPMELLHWHRTHGDYLNEDLASSYRTALHKYVNETLSTADMDVMDEHEEASRWALALKEAFRRLDNDLCAEALPQSGVLNQDALQAAMSGACASVALLRELDLHVASSGDCRAVLGQLDADGKLVAKPLTQDHNSDHQGELNRVINSHPASEQNFIMRNNRLLGQLIPLRAFGDARFKWSISDLKSVVNLIDSPFAQNLIPMYYQTPPYLTVEPDVTYHRLGANDRFLVLASDGLWEMLDNETVVRLVGEYVEGKETDAYFQLPKTGSNRLGALNNTLVGRQSGLRNKAVDNNVATHLIRHALGRKHRKVSEMLTLPPDVVRYYRDDITITVIYFDSQYLQQHAK